MGARWSPVSCTRPSINCASWLRLREASHRHGRLYETRPIGDAGRDRSIVKIVTGMMHAGRVAVAEQDERTRPGLKHEGKVLAAHEWRNVGVDLVTAGDLPGDSGRELGLLGMIDGHGILALIPDAR